MIYCSLEPGLLSLRGVSPHDTRTAAAVIASLGLHRTLIRETNARIPLTDGIVVHVLQDLEALAEANPSIQRSLRALILEILGRGAIPAVVPTGLTVQRSAHIISDWIGLDLQGLWLETIAAAIVDLLIPAAAAGRTSSLGIATWQRDALPLQVDVLIEELPHLLGGVPKDWKFPLLATVHDWCVVRAMEMTWPENLPFLVEAFAHRSLRIEADKMADRRGVRFEPGCLRDIAAETREDIRELVVEVIARRAYDLLEPRHGNERIRTQPHMWRVYVRKTAPPARLHYFFDGNDVVYSLYSESDHDKGL